MIKLELPNCSHEEVYTSSRERFVDQNFLKRLIDGQPDVLSLGADYLFKAAHGELHAIEENAAVGDHILSGDMQKLYNQGLLRKNSNARKFYERIKLSTPFRVCPLCLHRIVKTIDHYLPKKKFGAFAVLPANLLPCCRNCNTDKDEYAALNSASSLIHPYFDNIDGANWLGCDIAKVQNYCSPTFYIDSANVVDEILPRLSAHMETLDLFDLYDVEGAREINDMTKLLIETKLSSGAEGVKELCSGLAESRSALARNSWRAVLWRSAANDDEFCNLGWAGIEV